MAETVKKAKAPTKASKTTTKKASSNPTSISNNMPSHDQIAELASKYWAERGYTDGNHEDDWFRAEQALRSKAS